MEQTARTDDRPAADRCSNHARLPEVVETQSGRSYLIKPRNLAIIVEGKVSKADVVAYVGKDEEFEIITFPEKVTGEKLLHKGGKCLDESK